MNRVYISDGQGRLVDRSADFSRGADFTHSVAVGDLNGDGRDDILVEMKWPDEHRILLQGKEGRFSAATVPIGGIGANIAFGDVTGDGMQEMLLISSQQIEIWSTGAPDVPAVEAVGRRIVGTVAEVRANMTQQGNDVVFADQGTTVTLANTQLANIDDDTFIF